MLENTNKDGNGSGREESVKSLKSQNVTRCSWCQGPEKAWQTRLKMSQEPLPCLWGTGAWKPVMVLAYGAPWATLTGFILFLKNLICDKVSHIPGHPWPRYVSEDGFERLMHLSLSSSCWNYRCALPRLVLGSAGDQAHSFLRGRQELHPLNSIPSPKEKSSIRGFCFLRGPGGVLR